MELNGAGPRRALTGQVLPPLLTATAEAQRAGHLGPDSVGPPNFGCRPLRVSQRSVAFAAKLAGVTRRGSDVSAATTAAGDTAVGAHEQRALNRAESTPSRRVPLDGPDGWPRCVMPAGWRCGTNRSGAASFPRSTAFGR
ncbi:hypothetical protein BST45_15240 [Mycobacterium shinjukuense]|nr:hypothetical protein BST45_15240 [Mycobacterium shinjukuense]